MAEEEIAEVGQSAFQVIGSSFVTILVSELGDKTFFLCAMLAMKYSRAAVFTGNLIGMSFMLVLAASIGHAAMVFINPLYVKLASILVFSLFAATSFIEGLKKEEEEEKELEVMVREGISKKQEQMSKPSKRQKRGQKTDFKDSSYLSYEGERTFEKDKEFSQLAMELPMEDETGLRKSTKMKWDKKKRKYIQDQKKKKFLVDNKAKDLYKEWTKTTKKRIQKVGEKEDPDNMKKNTGRSRAPSDLKNKQQLVKEKKKAIKKNAILKHKKAKERQFASRQKTRYEKSSVAPRSKMIVKK
mmetsp:Transcript_6084/g.8998  ORF Transcript_6084/g.8998 Transcript_6084/m.8998 type:complete len:299 (+) Transcript_6084:46-942(+)